MARENVLGGGTVDRIAIPPADNPRRRWNASGIAAAIEPGPSINARIEPGAGISARIEAWAGVSAPVETGSGIGAAIEADAGIGARVEAGAGIGATIGSSVAPLERAGVPSAVIARVVAR